MLDPEQEVRRPLDPRGLFEWVWPKVQQLVESQLGDVTHEMLHPRQVLVLEPAEGKDPAAAASEEDGLPPTKAEADRAVAATIFNTLDTSRNGSLSKDEVVVLLMSWGIPYIEALRCFRSYDVDGTKEVTFEQFFYEWEPIWRFQAHRVTEAKTKFYGFTATLSQRIAERSAAADAQPAASC